MISYRTGLRLAAVAASLLVILFLLPVVARTVRPRAAPKSPPPLAFDYGNPPTVTATVPVCEPTSSLGGFVRDPAGTPIPGAIVALLKDDERAASIDELAADKRITTTDGDGRFHLQAPAAMEAWMLTARHQDYQAGEVGLDASEQPITIVLRPGHVISGRVLKANGDDGIGGVCVAARGVGAGPECARPDIVPPTGSACQRTQTAADGSFSIAGLSAGRYQLEIAADGLLSVPASTTVTDVAWTLPEDRAVYATAPAAGIEIRAIPMGVASVEVVETGSRRALPSAWIRFEEGGPFSRWTSSVSMSRDVACVNGRTVDLRAGRGSALYGSFFVSSKWPVPNETVTCEISAPGYESVKVSVPVVGVGSCNRPVTIELRATDMRGGVRFIARDEVGNGIGPMTTFLELEDRGGTATVEVEVSFDGGGRSAPLSLPTSVYRVKADGRTNAGLRSDWFSIERDTVMDVELRAVAAGLRVTVVDPKGREIGDAGLRMGRGQGPVRLRYDNDGKLLVTGLFSWVPGIGERPRSVYYPVSAGPWTVEAYRHGYEPARVTADVVGGRVTDVRMTMVPNPAATWDAWSRETENCMEDVLPSLPPRR